MRNKNLILFITQKPKDCPCSAFVLQQKAIPVQAWTGPEGSRRLRLPDFKTIVTWRWLSLSSLHTSCLYPQKVFLVLISVRGWVDPGAIVWLVGLCQWKIPMTPLVSYNKQPILINKFVRHSCYHKFRSNTHLFWRTYNLHNTLGIQWISTLIQFRDSKICQTGDIRITCIGRRYTSYQYVTNIPFLPQFFLRKYTFFWSTLGLHNLQQKNSCI